MIRTHARFFSTMLVVTLAATACRNSDDQARADSDLARDLALVNATPATPQLRDTALGTPADKLCYFRCCRGAPDLGLYGCV